MQSPENEPPNVAWRQIAPQLDAAIAKLSDKDRHAIVLRFFQNKSMHEIGVALGASEDAAKKRVNRALEKLHGYFNQRGISSTTAIMAAEISTHSIQAAPLALAKSVTVVAIAKGATASSSTFTIIKGTLKIMAWAKAKTAIVIGAGMLLAAGTATLTVKEFTAHRTPSWQEKFDLSLLDGLPPQVKILPSLPATKFNRAGARNGKVLALGQSFMALLEGAGNVIQSRLIVNAPIPGGKYDFILTYPSNGENERGLQVEIEKTFGVTIRRETIVTNVLILTAQSPSAQGLRYSNQPFSNLVKPDSYSIHGASLFTLVADLENSLGTVIINETQINGKYDIELKWDSTPDGLKRALQDAYGFKLTPSRKPIEFIVVDQAH